MFDSNYNRDIGSSVIRNNKKSPLLKRAVLARLFYSDMQNKTNDGLSVSDISKILLEREISHVQNYFYYKKIPTDINNELRLESMLAKMQQQNSTKFFMDKTFDTRLNMNIENSIGRYSIDEIIEKIKPQEKNMIQTKSHKIHSSLAVCKEYSEQSLNALYKNYVNFLADIRSEKSDLIKNIKNHTPHMSIMMRIATKMPFWGSGEILRLGFDMWAWTIYDLLLGKLYKEKLSLNYNPDDDILKETYQMIMDSQDDDGYWAVGKYDVGFQVIDTFLMTEIIYLTKKCFPDILVDKNNISNAHNFLKNAVEISDGNTGKIGVCRIKKDSWKQNSTLATYACMIGIYKTGLLLGNSKKQILGDETFVCLLRYFMESMATNGGFVNNGKTMEVETAEVETTALVTKGLFGHLNLDLTKGDISDTVSIKFEPIKTIGYFQNSWNTLPEYFSQGHINVVADTMHALLCCGVWPASTNLLGVLENVCSQGKKIIPVIQETDFLKLLKNGAGWDVISNYQKIIKVIGSLHEILFCTGMIDSYAKNPDTYWSRASKTLF